MGGSGEGNCGFCGQPGRNRAAEGDKRLRQIDFDGALPSMSSPYLLLMSHGIP